MPPASHPGSPPVCPASYSYAGDVGEYAGDVGEYAGECAGDPYCDEAGPYAGDVGVYAGDVGVYAGDVGVYTGVCSFAVGASYRGEVGVYAGDDDGVQDPVVVISDRPSRPFRSGVVGAGVSI